MDGVLHKTATIKISSKDILIVAWTSTGLLKIWTEFFIKLGVARTWF
jgi:hypothetical protein